MTQKGIWEKVIAGLILAAILWIVGILKPVFVAIGKAALWLVHAITGTVSVPVWLLVALAAVTAAALLRSRSLRRQLSSTAAPQVPPDSSALDENEMAVFRILADADGEPVSADQLLSDVGIKRLLLEKALEGLWDREYLLADSTFPRGIPTFRLSPLGVRAAIRAGLV